MSEAEMEDSTLSYYSMLDKGTKSPGSVIINHTPQNVDDVLILPQGGQDDNEADGGHGDLSPRSTGSNDSFPEGDMTGDGTEMNNLTVHVDNDQFKEKKPVLPLALTSVSAIPDLPPARTNEVPVSKWKYAPSKEALEMINDWYGNGIMNPKVLLERKKQCPLPEHQAFMVPELDSSVDTHVTTLRRSGIDANVSRFYDETLKDNLRRLIPIFGPLTIGAQHARNGTLTNEKAYDMFLRAGEFAAQAQFHMNFQRRVNILHGTKIRNKDNVKLCNNNWPDYATSSDVPPLMGPDLMKTILEETSVLAKNSRALVQAANMQRMPTHGPVLQAPNFKHQRNKPYSSEVQFVYQQRGGQYDNRYNRNKSRGGGNASWNESQPSTSGGTSRGRGGQQRPSRGRGGGSHINVKVGYSKQIDILGKDGENVKMEIQHSEPKRKVSQLEKNTVAFVNPTFEAEDDSKTIATVHSYAENNEIVEELVATMEEVDKIDNDEDHFVLIDID